MIPTIKSGKWIKKVEISRNPEDRDLSLCKKAEDEATAKELDLFSNSLNVRGIVGVKQYPQNSPLKTSNNDDEKNNSFSGNLCASNNDIKAGRKSLRNSFILQKESKVYSSMSNIFNANNTGTNQQQNVQKESAVGSENQSKLVQSNKPNLSKKNISSSANNKGSNEQRTRDLDPLSQAKLSSYKDWMFKINFSFNVIVKPPSTSPNFVPYKYFIGKGNNTLLLKTLMKQRWWWAPVESQEDTNVNFIWTQWKQNPFLALLKQRRKTPFEITETSSITNLPTADTLSERNYESATDQSDSDHEVNFRKNTAHNVTSANNTGDSQRAINSTRLNTIGIINNNINIAVKKGGGGNNNKKKQDDDKEELLLLKIMNKTDSTLLSQYTSKKRKTPYIEDEEELLKIKKKIGNPLIIDQSNTLKLCNHIENNFHLSNKKAMFYNMRNYYEALKVNVFDHLPLTFHVYGADSKEYQKFLEYYHNREKEIQEQEKLVEEMTKNNDKKGLSSIKKIRNIWIVKPGENTNRGTGINVCNELSQIQILVSSTELHPNGKKKTYIIQQYLDKPLLYNTRKFDIRCYMMITCINGIMRGKIIDNQIINYRS